MNRLDYTIIDLLESTAKNIKTQPLNLGGVSGTGGGAGGPPGGFIGYLPQTRVAYDEDEIASSGIVASGTLLDNLNHIRYRLDVVESGVLVVDEYDGSPSVSNVSRITFSGSATVTDMGGGRALVTITASGGGGGIPEAPIDSKNYARRNAAWADLDSYYLKLDASNDPITGEILINIGNDRAIQITQGGAPSNAKPAIYIHRVGADSYGAYPLEIYDQGAASAFNYNAGTFTQYSDDYNLIDINPYAGDGSWMVTFNSQNDVGVTGRLVSIQSQDNDRFTVYGDGIVNIPTGKTYNVGGNPHTHDGWNTYNTVIPTLTASDDPTYTLQFASVDLTSILCEGMPIKWTQNSIVRYGWVSSAPSYSGGNTSITVLTRTDSASANYDVVNTGTYPITGFAYGLPKQPGFGMPILRTNWRVETTSSSSLSQLTPTANTWYNILSISVPIGYWDFGYEVLQAAVRNSTTAVEMRTTLSTTNNGATNAEYTVRNEMSGATGNWSFVLHSSVENAISSATKTTWYFNFMTYLSSTAGIYARGDIKTTTIYLNCKYLEG